MHALEIWKTVRASDAPGTDQSGDTFFGSHLAFAGPRRLVIAAPNNDGGGLVTVYGFLNFRNLFQSLPVPEGDWHNFGASIAADARQIFVGNNRKAPSRGASRILVYSNGDTIELEYEIELPWNRHNYLRYDIALNETHVAVGIYNDTRDKVGLVRLHDRTNGELINEIRDPHPDAGDAFGISIVMNNDYLFVSAPRDDFGGPQSGSVFRFNLRALSKSPRIITHPDLVSKTDFGRSLAIADDVLLVAAPKEQGNSGRIHVYALDQDDPQHLGVLQSRYPNSSGGLGRGLAASGSLVAATQGGANSKDNGSGHIGIYDVDPDSDTFTRVLYEYAMQPEISQIETGSGYGLDRYMDFVDGLLAAGVRDFPQSNQAQERVHIFRID